MSPSNTRQHAQRECDAAIKNLDWALHHIKNLDDMGYRTVPELWEALQLAAAGIVTVQDMLSRVKGAI